MQTTYLWTFPHHNRRVEFGPYVTEDEAKSAFQRVYGYWPDHVVTKETFYPISHVKVEKR